MNNDNKRKINIGIFLILFVVFAFTSCSKENVDVEVENVQTEETSEELVTLEPTKEPSTEEPATEETTIETAEPEEVTPEQGGGSIKEPTTTEAPNSTNPDKETDNTEKVTPEPTKEPVVENTDTTKPSSFGTPQEYNGDPEGRGPGRIIVKGFNYNDIFDDGSETAWEGEYWTASNGVELKILRVEGRETGMIAISDGKGKDIEFNSPYMVAVAEAEGIDLNKYVADLNVTIPLASYKRTEIDINDADLVAYRDAYDYKLYANKGIAEYYTPYQYGEQVNLRFAVASDGISEFDSVGGIFWSVIRVSDYWEVKLNCVPEEFRWDGIHQVLRYLSPDGDALYQLIYEDCYTGRIDVLPEYDEWYSYENSQVMVHDTEKAGYVIYYFK